MKKTISRLVHTSLLLYLPEDGTWVPKCVGVFICVMYIVPWNAFVGKYNDYTNIKWTEKDIIMFKSGVNIMLL